MDASTNMYGCTPCPYCQSQYRWPKQRTDDGWHAIVCDDCGFVEKETPPFEPENFSGDEDRP